MNLQMFDLPAHQRRRKAPKVASLVALSIALSVATIICVYSPSLLYNPGNVPQAVPSSDSPRESIRRPEKDDEPEAANSPEIEPSEPPSSIKSDLIVAQTTLDRNNSERRSAPSPSPSQGDENEGRTRIPIQRSPEQTKRVSPVPNPAGGIDHSKLGDKESCDLFTGEWVPNPEAPYYTNSTCYGIYDHQNCMKYGRPDTNFLKWRWKPDGCELPIFDPHQFLEVVRGKSIAFVGDSLARNHMLSLMCLLSRVLYPLDVSTANDENRRWVYREYNFNVSMFWAPYLVRSERTDPNDITRPFNLYLDEFDDGWTTKVQAYDYIIISAGQWFFRPTNFYENRTLIGCLACKQDNVTQFTMNFSYERAFRTAFRAIISLANFKGVTILRTIAPSHFEGGVWDQGGDCVRTRPFNRNETVLADYNSELHKIQLKELRIAQEEGSKWGLRFRLFDVTQAMSLRPDGHPSKYGHWPTEKVTNDCEHWCLPGPIDAWNDFLQELIKREETKKSSYRYT
ncbi:protein trichome birefringence-like 19 [Coffea arabica]|uniref:Protein trichome birefringence-like 19 n=1 Tax=Coffea arabica TaxID=13443 RepID=A0A6P6TJK2_COFAR|nr:protein trichome birefringence-like 19 [Coffea arabica]